LASTLLGADPPELPVSHLVYVADLFGINENSARVALSRMVASGEVVTGGAGRYRLVGRLLERQQHQLVSRAGRTGAWSGGWHMVALTTTATADVRGQRRRALTRARLGELRQGLWLRPDNLSFDLDSDVRMEATVFSARPRGDAAELAASLWDLRAWASEARNLLRELRALTPKGRDELAPGFVLGAAVLRHFQADPLLPPELLPSEWPGTELRAFYDDWDASYRTVLASWNRKAPSNR
jgi:phenylacetic acid degradation operon negative regulatory protein